jgi:hypothetical protein
MSRQKRASTATDIYNDFRYGRFKQNPVAERTALIERMYIRILTELATNRFKWCGLPDSIDVRYLEMTLFYFALSVFYYDKRYDKHLAMQGGGTNWPNMMQNPVGFSVVGSNFVGINVSAVRDTEDAGMAIPIWANYQRMPDLDIVMIYAKRLADLDRTIEINSINARQNKFVVASENQKLTMVNINRAIDEGQNTIQISGALGDLQFIQALDLGINPDSYEKLHMLRTRIWNECMGLLGIDNSNQDKKERLVAAEVGANDDQTDNMKFVNLNARRQAVEAINKHYKLDVTVEYNSDFEKRAQQVFEAILIDETNDVEHKEVED